MDLCRGPTTGCKMALSEWCDAAPGGGGATYGLGLKETNPGVATIYFVKPSNEAVHAEYFSITPKGVYFRRTVRPPPPTPLLLNCK